VKSLFISLLALQPAAHAVLLGARRPAPSMSVRTIAARADATIGADAAPSLAPDLHDVTGHHRYYGQSACP